MDKILSLEGVHFQYCQGRSFGPGKPFPGDPIREGDSHPGAQRDRKNDPAAYLVGTVKTNQGQGHRSWKTPQDYSKQILSQMIGLVPQFETMPFNFSVFEYVLLGRSPYLKPFQLPGDEDLQITSRAIDQAGIGKSGG